jgi:hypothetical protein
VSVGVDTPTRIAFEIARTDNKCVEVTYAWTRSSSWRTALHITFGRNAEVAGTAAVWAGAPIPRCRRISALPPILTVKAE